jgi:hypothetical protein
MDSTQDLVETARKLITKEETVTEKITIPTRVNPPKVKIGSNKISSNKNSHIKHKSREVTRYSSKPKINVRHRSSTRAYLFFLATFAIWMTTLLIVYLPISGLLTPAFPFIISDTTIGLFLTATALVVITSLTLGLNRVRDKG